MSKKTQVPFNYFDLPIVCDGPSQKKSSKIKKSLGSRLMGQNVLLSPVIFNTKVNISPTKVCLPSKLNFKQINKLRNMIEKQYRVNMQLDDLPVIMHLKTKAIDYAVRGYPLGFRAPPSYSGLKKTEMFLYNHLKFKVLYREDPNEFRGVRIVGFEVMPVSFKHKIEKGDIDSSTISGSLMNNPKTNLILRPEGPDKTLEVAFTYEVKWERSDLFWSDRWDIYLSGNPDEDVHLYAVMNSLMICLFMTAVVVSLMMRTLKKEINAYNSSIGILDDGDDETDGLIAIDESGWKLVHGDVFRAPTGIKLLLLSVGVGTGVQIASTFLLSALLCLIPGVMSPMNKAKMLTNIIFIYVFCASTSGYISARIYKLCGGKDWKMNTIYTAAGFPGLMVSLFMLLNIFLTFVGAATSVSLLTIISVFLLWVCVSTPLAFVGSYFGFRREKIEVPTRVNQIARVIPDKSVHSSPWSQLAAQPYCYFVAGMLPFGSICIELFFLMNALWLSQVFYTAGVLVGVFFVMTITTAQVTVVMCYLQLCSEDYRWWTRSFLNGASSGFYMFGYGIWFLITKLELVGFLPIVVYLSYMFMMAVTFAVFLGSVGFLSCLWFTKTIYGALKVD